MRPIVHSKKHYVQNSLETISASTIVTKVIIDAVSTEAVGDPDEVAEGSSVKAVYVESWLGINAAAIGSYVYVIYKTTSNAGAPSTTQMAALHDWVGKKNVLFSSQGLLNMNNANATPVIRQWVKIPKSKQRFGLGDKLRISIFAQGAQDTNHCGLTIYKEYS